MVAPDPVVAEWCGEAIETGVPGFVLRPPVLPRTAIPVVTDPGEAAARLELGVLSVLAHGKTDQGATIASVVLAAVRGLDDLDDDRVRLYCDLIYNCLDEAARRALEVLMGYEYQSDFAKKYVAQGHAEGLTEGLIQGRTEGLTEGLTKGLTEGLTKGRTEGLTQGRTEGLTQGLTEGLTQGRTEGRIEEAARAVLTVLRVRGLVVPDADRERILSEKDPERLERWLEKAAVASSVAAVFD